MGGNILVVLYDGVVTCHWLPAICEYRYDLAWSMKMLQRVMMFSIAGFTAFRKKSFARNAKGLDLA